MILATLGLLMSCEPPTPMPKKYGFPRMNLPDSITFVRYESASCPFVLEAPAGGKIIRDLSDSCWMDIFYPDYNLTWHISHRDTRKTGKDVNFHFEEHRKLIYKHTQKASEIRPFTRDITAGKVTVHELFGEVGTPAYVFIQDTSFTQVAVMSFYFQTAMKNDSLSPLISHMKGALFQASERFRWK